MLKENSVWLREKPVAVCSAGMVSVPVHIYLGKYTAAEAFSFIGLQIIWVALLGIGVMAFYRFAIKKVVVQGG